MDDTCTLRSFPTALVGPSTHLDFTSGDVSFEIKHLVGCFDESIDTTLFQAHIFEKFLTLFVGFEFGNVGFGLRCHNKDFSSFVLHRFAHTCHIFIARSGRTFVHVAHIEHRLRGEQEKIASSRLFVFGVELHAASILTFEQSFFNGRKHLIFHLCVFVATHLSDFLYALDAVLHRFQILQLEFGVDDFLVAHRIHATIYVYHVAVVKTAQHVDDGISFADVAQELVAQSFTFRGTFHQTSDVDNLHGGGDDFRRLHQFSKFCQSFIRHSNHTHIGFDGAEREVGALRLGVAQAIKKRGLAHVGKSYDAAL